MTNELSEKKIITMAFPCSFTEEIKCQSLGVIFSGPITCNKVKAQFHP